MGLAVAYRKGRWLPCMTCDFCGEIITDWSKGNALFDMGSKDGPGHPTMTQVKVVHKGCNDKFDPEKRMGWNELPTHVGWMILNVGKSAGVTRIRQTDGGWSALVTTKVSEPIV